MASLGAALKKHREGAGLSQSEVEDQLNLGDQWIQEFEANRVVPTLAYLSRLAECYSVELAVLVGAFSPLSSLGSGLAHQPRGNSTEISFDFGRHRALYRLQDVDHGSFEEYLAAFRAEMSDDDAKADHVATAFRVATEMWPHLNASDIWYFLVSRLFVDKYNHSASFSAGKDMEQSWKRTSGWALERIVTLHYNPFLASHQIELLTDEVGNRVRREIASKKFQAEVNLKKIDVLIVAPTETGDEPIGILNVKASFAERRNADEAMSKALISKNYVSAFVTMDCKAQPGPEPENRGELGEALGDEDQPKRSEIEIDRIYDGCFSFNQNTIPTPEGYGASKIHVVDFSTNDDALSKHLINGKGSRLGTQ